MPAERLKTSTNTQLPWQVLIGLFQDQRELYAAFLHMHVKLLIEQ